MYDEDVKIHSQIESFLQFPSMFRKKERKSAVDRKAIKIIAYRASLSTKIQNTVYVYQKNVYFS